MFRFAALFLTVAAVACSAGPAADSTAFTASAVHPNPSSENIGFAVVELFTSEGCSSCPPADALLARLRDEMPGRVYALSFHVDYWNRLGWKDPFSDAAYTQRQYAYGKRFGLESVYTPQAVVNGAAQMVGSNERGLRAAVNSLVTDAAKAPSALPEMEVRVGAGLIRLSPKEEYEASLSLCIALVQPDTTVQVRRGENGGRSLRHTNVVRSLVKGAPGEYEFQLPIPGGAQVSGWRLIYFLQKENGRIVAADEQTLKF